MIPVDLTHERAIKEAVRNLREAIRKGRYTLDFSSPGSEAEDAVRTIKLSLHHEPTKRQDNF